MPSLLRLPVGLLLIVCICSAFPAWAQSRTPQGKPQTAASKSVAVARKSAPTGSGMKRELQPASSPTAPPPNTSAAARRNAIRQVAAQEEILPAETIVADAPAGIDSEGFVDEGYEEFVPRRRIVHRGSGIYGSAEALLWWTNGDDVPPLVTTSPVGTPVAQAGALNNANTTILFGDEPLSDALRGGVRFTLGAQISPRMHVEGSYFQLGTLTDSFSANSIDTPILARPFLNIANATDDHQRIAFFGNEGEVDGTINVAHSSELQGADVLGKLTMVQSGFGSGCARVQLTAGYRFLSLRERLAFDSTSTIVDDPANVLRAGTQFTVSEAFAAKNTFHGGDIGFSTYFEGPNAGFELYGRVAIGGTHQIVTINGSTTSVVPQGGTTTTAGGLFAQPTNIGTYTRDVVSFVPQFGADFYYNINPCWKFTVGYNFLFWSNVARPGEQIETAINPTQFNGGALAGSPRPSFQFNDGYLWAHGLSLGLECRF